MLADICSMKSPAASRSRPAVIVKGDGEVMSQGIFSAVAASSPGYVVMSFIGPKYVTRIVRSICMRVGTMRWVNRWKFTRAFEGRPCTVICGEKTTVMSRGLTIITPLSGSVALTSLGLAIGCDVADDEVEELVVHEHAGVPR